MLRHGFGVQGQGIRRHRQGFDYRRLPDPEELEVQSNLIPLADASGVRDAKLRDDVATSLTSPSAAYLRTSSDVHGPEKGKNGERVSSKGVSDQKQSHLSSDSSSSLNNSHNAHREAGKSTRHSQNGEVTLQERVEFVTSRFREDPQQTAAHPSPSALFPGIQPKPSHLQRLSDFKDHKWRESLGSASHPTLQNFSHTPLACRRYPSYPYKILTPILDVDPGPKVTLDRRRNFPPNVPLGKGSSPAPIAKEYNSGYPSASESLTSPTGEISRPSNLTNSKGRLWGSKENVNLNNHTVSKSARDNEVHTEHRIRLSNPLLANGSIHTNDRPFFRNEVAVSVSVSGNSTESKSVSGAGSPGGARVVENFPGQHILHHGYKHNPGLGEKAPSHPQDAAVEKIIQRSQRFLQTDDVRDFGEDLQEAEVIKSRVVSDGMMRERSAQSGINEKSLQGKDSSSSDQARNIESVRREKAQGSRTRSRSSHGVRNIDSGDSNDGAASVIRKVDVECVSSVPETVKFSLDNGSKQAESLALKEMGKGTIETRGEGGSNASDTNKGQEKLLSSTNRRNSNSEVKARNGISNRESKGQDTEHAQNTEHGHGEVEPCGRETNTMDEVDKEKNGRQQKDPRNVEVDQETFHHGNRQSSLVGGEKTGTSDSIIQNSEKSLPLHEGSARTLHPAGSDVMTNDFDPEDPSGARLSVVARLSSSRRDDAFSTPCSSASGVWRGAEDSEVNKVTYGAAALRLMTSGSPVVPESRSSSRGEWIVCRDYRATTHSQYGGRNNIWTRQDHLGSVLIGDRTNPNSYYGLGFDQNARYINIVQNAQISGNGSGHLGNECANNTKQDQMSDTAERSRFNSRTVQNLSEKSQAAPDTLDIGGLSGHHVSAVAAPGKSSNATNIDTTGFQSRYSDTNMEKRTATDEKSTAHRNINGDVTVASKISWKLTELAKTRNRKLHISGNRLRNNGLITKDVSLNRPISRELALKNRPISRKNQNRPASRERSGEKSPFPRPWDSRPRSVGDGLTKRFIERMWMNPFTQRDKENVYKSAEDLSLYCNRAVSPAHTTSTTTPITKQEAARFIHDVDKIRLAKAQSLQTLNISEEGAQELLDYFWSYQGMGRQILRADTADLKRETQGKQLRQFNGDLRKFQRLPPIDVDASSKSMEGLERVGVGISCAETRDEGREGGDLTLTASGHYALRRDLSEQTSSSSVKIGQDGAGEGGMRRVHLVVKMPSVTETGYD